jgi:hypothetical protein
MVNLKRCHRDRADSLPLKGFLPKLPICDTRQAEAWQLAYGKNYAVQMLILAKRPKHRGKHPP